MKAVAASLFRGFAGLFDVAGSVPSSRIAQLLDRSDEEAMASDWAATCSDLHDAFERAREDIEGP